MSQKRRDREVFPQKLLLDWDKSRVFANPFAKGAERLVLCLAEETEARLIRRLNEMEMEIFRKAVRGREVSNVRVLTGCEVDAVAETIQLIDQPIIKGLYYRKKDYKRLFIAVEKVSVGGLAYCYMASAVRSGKWKEPAHAEDQECCI